MNKYLFFLAFFTISGFSMEAQDYDPFIKEGSFWDVYSRDSEGFCDHNLRRYKVSSDTLINNRVYKKLKLFTIQGNPNVNWPDICFDPPYFIEPDDFVYSEKFIHEDVTNQKVYIWTRDVEDYDTFKEYTLYDFDVEVGDVIENSFFNFGEGMEVTFIQTNAEGRKEISVNSTIVSFIEGIGSYDGVFYNEVTVRPGTSHGLFCWGNNSNQNGCAEVLSVADERLAQIKIYPNPTSDKILFSNLENNRFKLYSILGKEMGFQFSEENREMDISHLKAGIYLLEIHGENGGKRIEKILKN